MKPMTSLLISTLLFLQLGMSCKKEQPIEPCNNPSKPKMKVNENFDLVWDIKVNENFICVATVVTPNEVVYWTWKGAGHNDYMVAFNKATGDTLWHRDATGGTSNHTLVGNNIYLNINDRLVCIDPSTGNEVWRYSPAYLSDYVFANGSIYAFFEQGHSSDSTFLYEINPTTGIGNKIFTISASDRSGYRQIPKGIAYWQHPNGNDILFVQSGGLNVSVGRGEYFAIDITGDSMYWDLGNYFNSVGIGSAPIIHGNNVILNEGWTYNASLDLVNKTVNWKTTVPEVNRTRGGTMVIMNNKIFQSVGNPNSFSGSSSVLNIFDLNTGALKSSLKNVGHDWRASPLRTYNNKIYFTATEYIEIVDANTNELIQKILFNEQIGDNLGGYPGAGLDVDPTNGNIYTTRGWSFVCIKEK